MKIALCHFRVGETDGVSLEMDKWKIALEKLGHEVVYIAGSKGTTDSEVYLIEELHYLSDRNNKIVENSYDELRDFTDTELISEIEDMAIIIKKKLKDIITENSIDMIVPNNVWSLGWGLSAGIGFAHAVKELGIPCVAHHHDFSWERVKYSNPTIPFIQEAINEYFPPDYDNISHVVINKIAQEELKKRRGISSTVVPNVFDFEGEKWTRDEYNSDFREKIGLRDNDILILQGTRIVERKAIELAIDAVASITKKRKEIEGEKLYNGQIFTKDSRIVLVFAGLNESKKYTEKLVKKAKKSGIEILFINDIIEHSRVQKDGEKYYSLWDAYVFADLITYPSILEGWGNQFLEGLFAETPMIVYEYPVFVTDIREVGFNIISLGDKHEVQEGGFVSVDSGIIEKAAYKAIEYLTNNEIREEKMKENFQLGYDNYSYSSLKNRLDNIFNN